MKNIVCPLMCIIAFHLPYSLFAQDSTYLDLGRIKVKKNFTQSVTVKGADLEKMPFANLADALQVWFNGAYTDAGGLAVVVDGNLVNDFNAWSIYDIEEVTLVQNATTVTNGAVGQKQLVVIKTKTSQPGKNGLTVAGQAFLVNRDFNTLQGKKLGSATNVYHQYYLSGYHNFKNVQVGLSANYLRDVMPSPKADTVATETPFQFNRIRLNAWMNAQLGKNHLLTIRMGYTPQKAKAEDGYRMPGLFVTGIAYEGKTSGIYPSLRLQSTFSKNWSNELNAAYLSGSEVIDSARVTLSETNNQQYGYVVHNDHDVKNLLIRDQVTYHTQFGKWDFEPTVNIQYRHINDILLYGTALFTNSNPSNVTTARTQRKGNLVLLTPAINLFYGNTFSIQAGTLVRLTKTNWNNSKDVYPFVSTTIDLLKLSTPGNAKSLKVFGSYAEGEDFFEQSNYIRDVATTTPLFPYPLFGVIGGGTIFTGGQTYSPVNKVVMAGLSLGLPADKFEASYQFTNRSFYQVYLQPIPIGTGYIYASVPAKLKTTYHRIGVTSNLVAQNDFSWFSGINLTAGKISSDANVGGNDIFKRENIYSGGWVNRFSYKQLSVGATLLYFINDDKSTGSRLFVQQDNGIVLQNFYIAYQLKLPKLKGLEVYADARNLVQDRTTNLTDRRKFYGLGFKAQL